MAPQQQRPSPGLTDPRLYAFIICEARAPYFGWLLLSPSHTPATPAFSELAVASVRFDAFVQY
jgi:hypothetical protein